VTKLSCQQLYKKYSKGYLKLLKDNLWIQSYRKRKPWDYEIYGLWIPTFLDLWVLAETHLKKGERLTLTREGEFYRVFKISTSEIEFHGTIPEEAILKLFIYLESPELYKDRQSLKRKNKEKEE